MVKAVFFDANGVLYFRRENDRYLKEFLSKHQIEMPPPQEVAARTNSLQDDALRGQISHVKYWDAILRACGVRDSLLAEGKKAILKDHGNIILFDGVIDTLKELKANGLRLGVVTDAFISKDTKLRWFAEQGLTIEWDAYANSMDLHTRKPDVRMYQSALEQANVTAGEAVFVGHDSREVTGARLAGLWTVAFKCNLCINANFFIEEFRRLLELPIIRGS